VAAASAETSEQIEAVEDDLMARRDALVKARQRIRSERDALDEKRRQAVAAGEDPAELDRRADELLSQEKRLVEEEEQLNTRYREILRQRREMMDALASSAGSAGAAPDPGLRVALRERSVADRERDIATREAALTTREAALADRERVLARREAETCGVAAAPTTTVIKTIEPPGAKYSKRDVEPLLTNARRRMASRGFLLSDLPEPARDLEKEATRAMEEGDYGRARFAASQLLSTVRSMEVDKAFISAKISRLNRAMQGKSLSPDARAEVDALFREATADYGDGQFANANKRLNRIYSAID
jgi:hypothetical protein